MKCFLLVVLATCTREATGRRSWPGVLRGGLLQRRSRGGPGWGDNPNTKYFSGHKEVARRPAHGYTKYGDEPPGSTFDSALAACDACVTFYPEKRDGKKWHAPEYQDEKGG